MLLKVGIVNFINTAPFYLPWRGIGDPPQWKVVEGPPSLLNQLLNQGKIQAGLVSSFEYGQNYRKYLLLRDISISATGTVKSVLLLSPVPIEDIRNISITITPKTATSVMLLRIILSSFYGLKFNKDFSFSRGTIEDAKRKNSPYLAIGDEALRLLTQQFSNDITTSSTSDCAIPSVEPEGPLDNCLPNFKYVYDLAEIWMRETGLPFVFAVLALDRHAVLENPEAYKELYNHIQACLNIGEKDIETISKKVAPRIPMTPGHCLSYLRGIEFDFDNRKREGLLLYFKFLKDLNVLDKMPELNFL
ncbi:Menaquinone via futalosine step 1 [Dissulfuribacter thermophilus]|uniref:Chorismate dehydratase n=1 Tax=Dissulfuribacter thermophilus TaxID=1156395 RepID=A0A1B9F7C8_9BACT|nr:menaquinone biosynthesis protein [Dissulfuribacter thermophilus]OCC15754.1 Menaquinone via futalosine step 1 [Dissulfuribacter thermophilus]